MAILSKYRTPSNDSVFQVQQINSPLNPHQGEHSEGGFGYRGLSQPMFTACILQSLCCHNFSFFFNILSILFQVIALSVVGLVVVVVAMVIMIRTLGTMILHQVGNWNQFLCSPTDFYISCLKQNINI